MLIQVSLEDFQKCKRIATTKENKTKKKSMKTTEKQMLFRMFIALNLILTFAEKSIHMIDLKDSFPLQIVITHQSAKMKIDFELSRVNFQRKVPEGK